MDTRIKTTLIKLTEESDLCTTPNCSKPKRKVVFLNWKKKELLPKGLFNRNKTRRKDLAKSKWVSAKLKTFIAGDQEGALHKPCSIQIKIKMGSNVQGNVSLFCPECFEGRQHSG